MNCDKSMYSYIKDAIIDKTNEKIIFYNNTIKAEELFEEINSLAFYLVNKGIKKGDSIGICLPNIPQSVISLYAINKIGAIANIIHPKISANALMEIIKETDTKIVFLYDRRLSVYEYQLKKENIPIISCKVSTYLKGIKKVFYKLVEWKKEYGIIQYSQTIKENGTTDIEFSSKAPAIYLHSGGTTGKPKTVVLSSFAFNKMADNVIATTSRNHKYETFHSMLMVLPLFHGFGLGICIHLSLAKFKVVMMPRFVVKDAIKLIEKHNINYLVGVPAMFEKFLKEDKFDGKYLKNIKEIFCGADKLNTETKEKFDSILKKNGSSAEILEGYGLSEVASVATINIIGESKKGTQGKSMEGVKIKILDEEKNQCEQGKVGQIIIQSESIMNCYFNKNDNENIFIDFDNEKWLCTGDMGYLDNENYLVFVGREKRMIKIAGVNIFPSEIERFVNDMEEIESACIVRDCINKKPCTKLFVVLKNKYKLTKSFQNKLKSRIEKQFIRYAVPKEIVAVKELSKTLMGKVDYRKYENQ